MKMTVLVFLIAVIVAIRFLLKNDISAIQRHDNDMKAEYQVIMQNQAAILNEVIENGRKLDRILSASEFGTASEKSGFARYNR